MSQENKDLVSRMEEALFNQRNLDAIDEFISPDYVLRTAPEGTPGGRDAVREYIGAYLAGFSDLRISIDELLADGDRVIGVFTFTGTNDGELFGMPATGKRISVRQIAIYRIVGEQVVEEWEISDQLGLMQQLSVIPAG
jgi:predicted ester cyclase